MKKNTTDSRPLMESLETRECFSVATPTGTVTFIVDGAAQRCTPSGGEVVSDFVKGQSAQTASDKMVLWVRDVTA